MIHHSSGGGSSATAAALPRALPAAGRLSRCRPFSLHPRWGPPWEQCVPSVQYNAESPSAAPTTPSPPTPALRGTPVPSATSGASAFSVATRAVFAVPSPQLYPSPHPPRACRLLHRSTALRCAPSCTAARGGRASSTNAAWLQPGTQAPDHAHRRRSQDGHAVECRGPGDLGRWTDDSAPASRRDRMYIPVYFASSVVLELVDCCVSHVYPTDTVTRDCC